MYHLLLTNSADNDIKQIIVYLKTTSGSKQLADSYLEKIEKAILSLKNFPERGVNPRHRTIRGQGYKFLVVESHIIFYTINDDKKIVYINRVLHHKNNYKNLL